MERRVVCAAIKNKHQHIICGPRHYDMIMRKQMRVNPSIDEIKKDWINDDKIEQGFVDQYGVFMTREEAYIVAKENNQIIRRCGGDDGRLYSENLY